MIPDNQKKEPEVKATSQSHNRGLTLDAVMTSKFKGQIEDGDFQDEEEIFQKIMEEKRIKLEYQLPNQHKPNLGNSFMKKNPALLETTPQKSEANEIKTRTNLLKFGDLPEQIAFYITEIYPYDYNLFVTGVMPNGQSLSLVLSEIEKQLYFVLKEQKSDISEVSNQFLNKAQQQIKEQLYNIGIKDYQGKFVEKEYVFEIKDIPQYKRKYYQVRFPFKQKTKKAIEPNWEGQTFKYVFGTTYKPIELFVVNAGIKGPSWVTASKKFMTQNKTNVEPGRLCVDMIYGDTICTIHDKDKPKIPNLSIMAMSLRTFKPDNLVSKRLFPNCGPRGGQNHIYCISYSLCTNYSIQLKPRKYDLYKRTYYLKQFADNMKINNKDMVAVDNEKNLIAQFIKDIHRYDPDLLVCHDSSKTIDTLIMRMKQISKDRNDRTFLGRLKHFHYISEKDSQQQRISTAIAGRLLVDTYLHSKQMIKSIDYELGTMAEHIKPTITFKSFSDEDYISQINQGNSQVVIKKVMEEADVTFALMNHLEVVQMSRQITNICGYLWRGSLQNKRAQRNQYLIMHECFHRNLIIPDKIKLPKTENEEHKKYEGGLVLQPKKGFYLDFILLLDFNSLYPSIIRQYNICFSVIQRKKVTMEQYLNTKKTKGQMEIEIEDEDDSDEKAQPPPKQKCVEQHWGFLPHLIHKIVSQRQKIKKSMKKATAQKAIIFDIQQKCYKLVANSIYGCLGFKNSRFYSKPLAELITRMGREALMAAQTIVSQKGLFKVIYGDTDSLMLQPKQLRSENEVDKIFEIKNMAYELKNQINKHYTNLQIDIDGIFKPIMLLMKKRYVAKKLSNYDQIICNLTKEPKYSIEYKGIQVVRRDGCQISRNTLSQVLQICLKAKQNQVTDIYNQIYTYMSGLRAKLEALGTSKSSLNYECFQFSKQLNKKIKEYKAREKMPHVKVAEDMIKGGVKQQTLVNHTIYYVVCKSENDPSEILANKCYDMKKFKLSQSTDMLSLEYPGPQGPLQIDVEYYKHQILQPLMRITAHLIDFDHDRLLDEFGVDSSKRLKIKKLLQGELNSDKPKMDDFLTSDPIQKSKIVCQELGQHQCKCGKIQELVVDGMFVIRCTCGFKLLTVISNKISYLMKMKCNQYYNNRVKCRNHHKQCLLQPLQPFCCKESLKYKSSVPFEIHKLIYFLKNIAAVSIRRSKKNYGEHNGPQAKQINEIKTIETKLNDFLCSSEFQYVSSMLKMFSSL